MSRVRGRHETERERVRRRFGQVLPAEEPPPTPVLPGRLALAGFDPGRAGIRVLAVLAVVVAIVAGVLAWLARPDREPLPSSPVPVVAAPSTTSAEIVVTVAGRVRKPGLVHLPTGARVADAVAGAGGPLSPSDLAYVNLARKVTDGELILIGVTAPPGSMPAQSGGGGLVNLNTASVDQLQTLPGVGPVLAERIIQYRQQHGGFHSIGELRQVTGIGDSRYAELKDLVSV